MRKNNLFIAAPFFMARTPFLTVQDFFSLIKNGLSLSHFSPQHQSLIREAIAIASPSLYEAIYVKKKQSAKEQAQVESSLLKYLLRMTSRSTPFGLFSFVSVGSWGEKLSSFLDLNHVHKRARPDMEWLTALIEQICTNPKAVPFLYVKKNPLVFCSGGRAHLNYFRKKEGGEKDRLLSIRLTFLTEAIFEIASKPVQTCALNDQIMARFPSLEPEKVFNYVQQLLKHQFLTYTLFPSLLTDAPFKDFFLKLIQIPVECSLDQVFSELAGYNKTAPGEGEDIFHQLQRTMKAICPAKNYLQVDAANKANSLVLPKQISHELEDVSEVLWKLSYQHTNFSFLQNYHARYLEKYGIHRKINLLELLNEETGLGLPDGYFPSNANSTKQPKNQNEWMRWLKNEWTLCMRDKKTEIEITSDLIDKILDAPNKQKALLSFELFCEVISESHEAIEKGDFLLNILSLSWQGGNTFGRFLDILDGNTKQNIQDFLKKEESLEPESLFSAVSHFSFFPRLGNVMNHPNLRDHAIDLESLGNNYLEEIYVCANYERLYLTLKGSPKELIVTNGNMLNPIYSPTALRFLQDVSKYKYQPISAFSWGELEEHVFLPRVRFCKAILSPARWKVSLLQISLTGKESLGIITEALKKWCDQWDLPRYLYLTENDHRILLDRTNSLHMEQIASRIQKGSEVKLVEKIGQVNGQWLQSQQGTHFCEFVIPFLKNKQFTSKAEKCIIPRDTEITAASRWKLLGSEWIYLKCYLGPDSENRFLMEYCFPFVEDFLQKEILSGWFFVRYSDPKPHIRLRFRIASGQLTNFLNSLYQWISFLVHDQIISDIAFGSYEREIERYGGEELINFAETFFYKNSLASLVLLQNTTNNQTVLSEEIVGPLSIITLLKQAGFGLQEQLRYFSLQELSPEELVGFRDHKSHLLFYSKEILGNNIQSYSETNFFCQAMDLQKEAMADLVVKMQDLEQHQLLPIDPFSIFKSLIHMHCNRLLGRDSKKEKKANIYAYYTLKALSLRKTTTNST